MSRTDLERYTAACNFPGTLNSEEIETHLQTYLQALGVERKIQRLESMWNLADHPSLERQIHEILDDFEKRSGRKSASDARDASAALEARDAEIFLKAFAQWCIQGFGWWYWRFDISWIATTYFGAKQLKKPDVVQWSKPLFDAYLAGCWMIHWTADTLYWVAKPTVHVERTETVRRLHNATGPALESDIENLYFWHGVLVPAYAVTHPQWITSREIDDETNAEVRRVLIERYGAARYLIDTGAEISDRDEAGLLYRKLVPGDEEIVMVRVLNSTPEPDGVMSRDEAIAAFGDAAKFAIAAAPDSRWKEYMLRVPPNMRTAREAIAWTFGMKPEDYQPEFES